MHDVEVSFLLRVRRVSGETLVETFPVSFQQFASVGVDGNASANFQYENHQQESPILEKNKNVFRVLYTFDTCMVSYIKGATQAKGI